MGPGDPFSPRRSSSAGISDDLPSPRAPCAEGSASSVAGLGASSLDSPAASPRTLAASAAPYLATGAILGALLGVVVLLKGVLAALILGIFAGLGGGFGVVTWAVVTQQIDVQGALASLLRRPPR